MRETCRKPVVFGYLEFGPFFHGENPSDFASAAEDNVIKRPKYSILESVTKRVNINCQEHPNALLDSPAFERISKGEIFEFLFSRGGSDVDSLLITGDIIKPQFDGPVCTDGNVQLKD